MYYLVSLVGLVAQLVEQRIENPRVGGSIPPQATNKIKDLEWKRSRSFCFVRLDVRADVSRFLKSPPCIHRGLCALSGFTRQVHTNLDLPARSNFLVVRA